MSNNNKMPSVEKKNNSILIGYVAGYRANRDKNNIMGSYSDCKDGSNNNIFGTDTKIIGNSNYISGNNCFVKGDNNIIIGNNNIVNGDNNIITGNNNIINSVDNIILGHNNNLLSTLFKTEIFLFGNSEKKNLYFIIDSYLYFDVEEFKKIIT